MTVKRLTVEDFTSAETEVETGEDKLRLTIEQEIIFHNLLTEARAKLTQLPVRAVSPEEFQLMYQKASFQCEVYQYIIEKAKENVINASKEQQ